jgi:hypothetical protein
VQGSTGGVVQYRGGKAVQMVQCGTGEARQYTDGAMWMQWDAMQYWGCNAVHTTTGDTS